LLDRLRTHLDAVLAEQVEKFVKNGDPLYVEGRLEYRTFQDEEGKERGVAEVIAGDCQRTR
jgi:single-strand DNA-binding protein